MGFEAVHFFIIHSSELVRLKDRGKLSLAPSKAIKQAKYFSQSKNVSLEKNNFFEIL